MIDRLRRALAPRDPRETGSSSIRFTDLYPAPGAPAIPRTGLPPAGRQVAASLSSQLLAPANARRQGLIIRNGSAAGTLYLAHGPWASSGNAVLAVGPGASATYAPPGLYQGDVAGVWSSIAGGEAAFVTETV